MLVFPDGTTRGTVGGGALETRAAEQAVECLASGTARRELCSMGGGPGQMLCGGEAEYLIVPVE
jgi:xanthine/CO dehydrogenase XdhC/CoxF family maturation factor